MQLNFATYQTAAAVTPSDSTAVAFRAVYVGGAGSVALRTVGGNTVTFTAPPVGTILPVECDRVMATNTTATLLIGLA